MAMKAGLLKSRSRQSYRTRNKSKFLLSLLLVAALTVIFTYSPAMAERYTSFKFSKQLVRYNHGGPNEPKYLVIHETDGYNLSSDAKAHIKWNDTNPNCESSANFYVDNQEAIQAIEMGTTPYSCGGGTEKYPNQYIFNSNSITIEMCVNDLVTKDKEKNKTQANIDNYLRTIDITIRLIREIILPEAANNNWNLEIVRHKDVYGKDCPHRLISGKWGITWEQFCEYVYSDNYQGISDIPNVDDSNFKIETLSSTSNIPIMGYSPFNYDQAKTLLLSHNYYPKLNGTIDNLLTAIDESSKVENVDPHVVFSQAMLETGWLYFDGDVQADQNNFCGLGATGGGENGDSFASINDGITAQVQHLKAYASTDSLNGPLLDPRFSLPVRGSAPTINLLSGKWATDKNYGQKIYEIYSLFNFSNEKNLILNKTIDIQGKETFDDKDLYTFDLDQSEASFSFNLISVG